MQGQEKTERIDRTDRAERIERADRMLTISDIKKMSAHVTFTKGCGVFNKGKVPELKCDYGSDGGICIEADVKGSYIEDYHVKISLDSQGGILSHYCECPAHASYSGLCKHCVAVLLAYLQDTEGSTGRSSENMGLQEKPSGPVTKEEKLRELDKILGGTNVRRGADDIHRRPVLPERITPKKAVKPEKKFSTTPGLGELISEYSIQDTASFLPEASMGQVKLEPYIEFKGSYLQVEFKIGITRMYVLKSISKMAAAIENLETVAYGNQLSFLHCIGAFEPGSRKLAQFLVDNAGGGGFYYRTPYGRYQSYSDDRYININKKNADDFMAALAGQAFWMVLSKELNGLWKIENKMPPWDVCITRAEGGISLRMNMYPSFEGKNFSWYFYNGIAYQVSTRKLKKMEKFLYFMTMRTHGKCQIADEDLPGFFQNVLPTIENIIPVRIEGIEPAKFLPPKAEFEIYLDMPQKDMISCRLLACYGEQKYNVFADSRDIRRMAGRDIRHELEADSLVRQYFMAYDEDARQMVLQGEDAIYDFLMHGIDGLQETGEVFISDKLKAVRLLPPPKVSVGVSLSGGMMDLELDCEGMPMEELVAVLSRYDRRKKYFRLKNGDFINMDEDGIRVLSELKEGLQLKPEGLLGGNAEVPKYRALYLDEELREEQSVPFVKSRDFRALIRNMKTVEDNDFEIPQGLNATLREYQKRGFLWIKTLCRNGFGGILADDMGLGKTLQVITFLLSEQQENRLKRSLIVAPASLVYNWLSEFERFAPSLNVTAVTGTREQRQEIIQASPDGEILITSYDLLRRDIDIYKGIPFFTEVIDEAQFIKNHTTQGARSVKQIQAEFRLALTGTPVENALSELWSIFDYLMPGFLYSYTRFREQLETPIVRDGNEEAVLRLQKMIRPFVLRRLKKDVLRDLPDKIEKISYAMMSGEQKQLYDAHVQKILIQISGQSDEDFSKSQILMLAELTKLRQLCCAPSLLYEGYKEDSAKLELCLELIENAVAGGHKLLLFSQFTSMLELITEKLTEKNISFYKLTGSTSKEKRRDLVEQFNQDATSVFCISLKAGGTGLNLTAADIVLHYDPWWNAAAENQATDRAHRIGQKNVVTVYKLVAQGTIEEKIIELQNKKKELADKVLSGEELKSGSFTREEIMDLLGSGAGL